MQMLLLPPSIGDHHDSCVVSPSEEMFNLEFLHNLTCERRLAMVSTTDDHESTSNQSLEVAVVGGRW